jgi:SAM-dependent methyltransferase
VSVPSIRLFSCLFLVACFTAASASAQITSATSQEPFRPTVGQQGKDVVWVPTTEAMVEKMLDHAKVTPDDFVMDLGSGDGRMIIAAAKRGARGLGVEYNPDMVELSKRAAADAGVAEKAQFAEGDMYEADISKATVLALFLLPHNLEKLVPKFLELPPGTRIVANTYWVRDWTADDTQTMDSDCDSWCTSYLFYVPAKIAGTWRLPAGVLTLTQQYQMFEGTFTRPNEPPVPVKGRLHGSAFTATVGNRDYEGSVNGTTIEAFEKGLPAAKIVATRDQ